MQTRTIKLWDLPTRLFHWSLVLLMLATATTGIIGGSYITLHGQLGIAILGLLAFRLTWGFVGSTYARFSNFIRGPQSISAYLRGQWTGVGHNPLGAFSVLGLIGLTLFQACTGLFANDDIAFTGPLFSLVSKSVSNTLTSLHRLNIWPLGALVALHIAAIVFYRVAHRENLVTPMVTGEKVLPHNHPAQSARGGGWIAFLFALAVAGAVVWVASGKLLPPAPPPMPVEAAPAW